MTQENRKIVATVVICTRNRAAYLGGAIRAAAAQTLSSGAFEILVVDNGSTDRTADMVRECQQDIDQVEIRYVLEKQVGLSAARNRGIIESRGEILCFLDDDAIPENNWLERLVLGFSLGSGDVMCVGGRIIPIYQSPLPDWFTPDLEFTFKPAIDQGRLHEVHYPRYPYGANFAIRAEICKKIGNFNVLLGYKDSGLIPCEETEYLYRIEIAGYRILMDPDALVKHIIPSSRLRREFLRQRYLDYGKGHARMFYLHQKDFDSLSLRHDILHIFKLIKKYLILRSDYLFMRFRNIFYLHPCLAEELRILTELGKVEQMIKILSQNISVYMSKIFQH